MVSLRQTLGYRTMVPRTILLHMCIVSVYLVSRTDVILFSMKAIVILFVFVWTGLCTATGPCRDGWLPFEEDCYYFSHNLLSWPQAAETCEALHSTLATVLSAEEHTFLKTTLMKIHPSDAAKVIYWIDGTDLEVEHVWRWASSGELLSYQEWATGEPTNTGSENCLLLWGVQGFKMGDNPCGASWNYVCKSSLETGENIIG
ncbi:perlucin-like protein [Pecten maximus]|uniref:perlucin-like protein n=1 Tax=Pecten maximus TaxID=6579 RepID=UPI0014581390|nr:perlucin-like protein [Pecten maximus]